jgi:hypothetical protein
MKNEGPPPCGRYMAGMREVFTIAASRLEESRRIHGAYLDYDAKPNSFCGVSHKSVRRSDASGKSVAATPSSTP